MPTPATSGNVIRPAPSPHYICVTNQPTNDTKFTKYHKCHTTTDEMKKYTDAKYSEAG